MNHRLLLFSVSCVFGLLAGTLTQAQDIRSCSVPDPNPLMECSNCPTKVLWVLCAADSAAIAPYDSLPFGKLGLCGNHRRRAEYPTTYRMPSWASLAFDAQDDASVTSYFLDQSYGAKLVTGEVIGATDSTIFRCDPNIWLEPSQCSTHSAGQEFVTNIMQKVDSLYDLGDFLSDPNDTSVFVFFNLYGHAETRLVCCDDSGNAFLYTYTSAGAGLGGTHAYESDTDTNAAGELINIRGITGWTDSEEWLTGRAEGGSNPMLASYWAGVGMFAHEFGHTMGLMHTFNDGGGDAYVYDHIPTGSFDIMSYSPTFWDKTNLWFRGQPSPYNPVSRMRILHWIDPLTIDRPQFEIQIGDNIVDGSAVKLPAYVNPATDPYDDTDGQYFVAVASTRESLWERWMPSDGVIIYHYNENGIQTRRGNKKYDMELKTGLFDWTIRNEITGDGVLPTGENLLLENPVTGLDSFDFRVFHNDTFVFDGELMPLPHAEFVWAGEHGSPGNYWVAGDTFDGNSNPSTNAYDGTNGINNPQSLSTNAGFAVLAVDPINHITTITAWSRHWRGTVSANATWLDSVIVDSAIVVASNARLTIMPGTKIFLEGGATLTVNGELYAVGSSSEHIAVRCKDIGEKWSGIKVNSGGKLTMDYVDMWSFRDYGIYTDAPAAPVSINHANLNCADLRVGGVGLRLWNSPTVTQYVKNTHVYSVVADSQATGMYLQNCKVNFDSVTIEDCDWVNSYIKKVTGSFHACTFRNRVDYYAVLFNSTPNTPNFMCCSFLDLAPTSSSWPSSVFCGTGTSPTFGGEGYDDGVSNVFEDSSDYLMIMQGALALPVIDSYDPTQLQTKGGRNDWKNNQTDGKFIEWRTPGTTTYLCEGQHWANGVDTTMFTPSSSTRWDYTPFMFDEWGLCGGGEGGGGGDDSYEGDGPLARDASGILDDVNYDSLYAVAIEFEEAEDYAAAQQLFKYVVENAPEPTQRWNALAHVVVCESFVQQGSSWAPELISNLITLEDSYEAGVLGERLRASYHQNREEYEQAIETCVTLLGSGLTYDDSIQVAIDLVGIQTSMESGGGSLDGAGTSMIPATLKARDDEHAMEIERDLLALLNPRVEKESHTANVPREFKLYPNHPNPFNPSTQIEFDIPDALPVTLKVFNSLGQEVTTVVDRTLNAGHHTLIWDGKTSGGNDVATGVYVYQIKAGGFMDAKKMVLIR